MHVLTGEHITVAWQTYIDFASASYCQYNELTKNWHLTAHPTLT